MTSRTTARFRRAFAELPVHVQHRAREAYRLFADTPTHPSLNFKRVHTSQPVYSARVGIGGYRALAILDEDTCIWFWIGNHDDYERMLRGL